MQPAARQWLWREGCDVTVQTTDEMIDDDYSIPSFIPRPMSNDMSDGNFSRTNEDGDSGHQIGTHMPNGKSSRTNEHGTSGESEATSTTTIDEGQEDTEDEDDKYEQSRISLVGISNRMDSVEAVHSDEATLQDIIDQYLIPGEKEQNERGATLMLRDIPYHLQVEPDLLDLLQQTCEMEHVDYIYLPMNMDSRSGAQTKKGYKKGLERNKGYCFIHFSVAATAQEFASRMHNLLVSDFFGGKRMTTTLAKFQGLATNLMNVLEISTSSSKWRPKAGSAHIRLSKRGLVCVGLLPLRTLLKRGAERVGKKPDRKAPGSGRKARRPLEASGASEATEAT
jgi:hypothetical protein